MRAQGVSIHQSGEFVRAAGIYEVIGTVHLPLAKQEEQRERSIRFLTEGEFFPNWLGRAVCWHLLASDLRSEPASPRRWN